MADKENCNDKTSIEELKEKYKEIKEKYNFPSFDELNREFQIEKASECESDYLIREIRKFVADKFSNYLRFIETILHPMNAPMFVFSIIKSISVEEKNKLTEAYKELAKYEVKVIKLDVSFNEEMEAEFIRESYKAWQKIKENILSVIEIMEKNWDNKFEGNNKGYFG